MRIAMVGPFGFHPNKTMRSRALKLAQALARRDHAVKMIMPPWHTPEEADRSWQEGDVQVRYTALRGGKIAITRRMIAETLLWQPEIVHTFKPKAYSGLVAWWLWNFHRQSLKLVVDTDDWEGWGGWNDRAPYSWLEKRFFAWQERWGMRHCHALTVASRTLQSLAWASGVPARRVYYLPNGPGIKNNAGEAANIRLQLGLAERPVLLLYSRLFEFDTTRLIEVLLRVKDALPDFALLVIGSGLYEQDDAAFRRQLTDANLGDHVVESGWKDEDDLPHWLASADAGIYLMEDTLLNRTKCPVKLADMVSIGLPVVAEDVGQVGEYVIHNQTGLLCQSGDAEALAQSTIKLLTDRAERERMGAEGRGFIEQNFSWTHLAAGLEALYHGLLQH